MSYNPKYFVGPRRIELRSNGLTYHYCFHSQRMLFDGLDFLFTHDFTFGWQPSSLYTFLFLGFARDCHAEGSPEFDCIHLHNFLRSAPFRLRTVFIHMACVAQQLAFRYFFLPTALRNRRPSCHSYVLCVWVNVIKL